MCCLVQWLEGTFKAAIAAHLKAMSFDCATGAMERGTSEAGVSTARLDNLFHLSPDLRQRRISANMPSFVTQRQHAAQFEIHSRVAVNRD